MSAGMPDPWLGGGDCDCAAPPPPPPRFLLPPPPRPPAVGFEPTATTQCTDDAPAATCDALPLIDASYRSSPSFQTSAVIVLCSVLLGLLVFITVILVWKHKRKVQILLPCKSGAATGSGGSAQAQSGGASVAASAGGAIYEDLRDLPPRPRHPFTAHLVAPSIEMLDVKRRQQQHYKYRSAGGGDSLSSGGGRGAPYAVYPSFLRPPSPLTATPAYCDPADLYQPPPLYEPLSDYDYDDYDEEEHQHHHRHHHPAAHSSEDEFAEDELSGTEGPPPYSDRAYRPPLLAALLGRGDAPPPPPPPPVPSVAGRLPPFAVAPKPPSQDSALGSDSGGSTLGRYHRPSTMAAAQLRFYSHQRPPRRHQHHHYYAAPYAYS